MPFNFRSIWGVLGFAIERIDHTVDEQLLAQRIRQEV